MCIHIHVDIVFMSKQACTCMCIRICIYTGVSIFGARAKELCGARLPASGREQRAGPPGLRLVSLSIGI